eukprot:TRINITY_DN41194_c0_g1_i1.p1 TRINITY_DN41194_c0_g1~~TRINITY_DN41194_c0_g1_i1.p1  ORF type:complete len:281 (+),score=56.57 TRINITY_DN41194_c0_g1_i1:65-907(+)
MNLKALIKKAKEPEKTTEKAQAETREDGTARSETSPELKLNLDQLPEVIDECRVRSSLQNILLVEEWLPLDAEARMISQLEAQRSDFIQLRGKRTARYGGDAGPPFVPEVLPSWLQELCAAVAAAWTQAGSSDSVDRNEASIPNHVLINHYQPGGGIMPHTDGPAYHPQAAIISLGSAVVFDFWRNHAQTTDGTPPVVSLLVPPRSLLLFDGEAYKTHLHGIADRTYDSLGHVANWSQVQQRCLEGSVDAPAWFQRQIEEPSGLRREERYSLTVRYVPPS